RTAGTGRDNELDRLRSTRVSEIEGKRDLSAADERIRDGNLERREVRAARVDWHVRISGVTVNDSDARSGRRESGGDCGLCRATVVFDAEVQFHAFGPVNDAVVVAKRIVNR